MNRKKFPLGCTMAFVLAVVIPMLASSAWARSKEKVLYEFPGGKHGFSPVGGVVFDKAGNLYGTTEYAGAYGWGTVFELKRSGTGWKQSVIYSFRGHDDGFGPSGSLVLDQAGNIYGFTPTGGTGVSCQEGYYAECGTVYRLNRSGDQWIHTVLYSFSGAADGGVPSGLVMDSAGNLYGTTLQGGQSQCACGTVFTLTPTSNGWTETVLYSFAGDPDGASPFAGVVFDGSGNLYGTTFGGGANGTGAVFQLSPNSGGGGWIETVLYSFGLYGHYDGYGPHSSLIFDAGGNLYGTTYGGGVPSPICSSCGTVFQLTPSSQGQWAESILFSFGGFDGAYPVSGLTLDQAGALYGTTHAGGLPPCGQPSCGVVFKLAPDAGRWTETVLHSFAAGNDGNAPSAGVVFDDRNNLYGTTSATYGTVFEVTR